MAPPQMYSNFEICNRLQPKEKCVRLRKYNHGKGEPFTEFFHEHIPAHRMSDQAGIEMLKALVLRHEKAGASYILRCYLNKRGRHPEACSALAITIEYPEPGVLRKYCGGDVQGWIDTVITPTKFRRLQPKL